jgi:RHS repeat-associated protein
MPGRKWNNGNNYQYGFGGKRKDNEIYGEGNAYDFGARIYDPRIVKWLSIDPVKKEYESPYMAFAGNPIWLSDPNGKDTTLPAANGKNTTLPDDAKVETYQPNTSYVFNDKNNSSNPSNGKEISVQAGQLRAFTLDGVRYQARWKDDLSFAGYQDDNGNSILQEVQTANTGFFNTYHPTLVQGTTTTSFFLTWDASVRVNSYINPMFGQTLTQFNAGEISANSASMRRYFFEMDARAKLTPWGRKFSQLLKSDALAYQQTTKFLNTPAATQDASKIFKLRPWVNSSARFLKVAGPIVGGGAQVYSYYTIIRDKKDFNQVNKELDSPMNPVLWLLNRTLFKLAE